MQRNLKLRVDETTVITRPTMLHPSNSCTL